ncbi:MAG TPA: fibronectin type III domain-containing protein, partial [Actinoplanes sp.]|nr:fibronectin type III domain-containing protein [Actinoplanes sp.]
DEPTPGVYAVPSRSASAQHEPAAQQSAPRPHAPAPGVPDMRPEPYGSDPPQALRPEMPPPDDRITDPQGAIYQQPLYLSDLNQPPGEPVGRHARADTPPPLPGQRVPEYTADGHLVPIGSAPVRADQRLPVPREKPEPASSRGAFVLAAVIVAGVGVAAAVVAATLPRGEARPPAPTTSATPPAATASSRAPAPGTGGGDAPAGVRLRDNRDNVTLTWTYPKGSEGPVLVSGGRSGEPQRAFQQLPAGTSDYVVYGLNEQLDYCFTVAVVHSTDKVSPSQVVCTARR